MALAGASLHAIAACVRCAATRPVRGAFVCVRGGLGPMVREGEYALDSTEYGCLLSERSNAMSNVVSEFATILTPSRLNDAPLLPFLSDSHGT